MLASLRPQVFKSSSRCSVVESSVELLIASLLPNSGTARKHSVVESPSARVIASSSLRVFESLSRRELLSRRVVVEPSVELLIASLLPNSGTARKQSVVGLPSACVLKSSCL